MRITTRYIRRLPAAAAIVCFAAFGTTANAVPVNYDESVDGPLATNPLFVTAADALLLDVGTNVISGTASWATGGTSVVTTFDTALLDLSPGLEILSITLSLTNVSGTGILSNVAANLLDIDATITSISALDSANLSPPGTATLFATQLPIDTAGFYGLCLCGFGGSLAGGQYATVDYTWSVVVGSVTVPEPETITLLISGLLGMALGRRRLVIRSR